MKDNFNYWIDKYRSVETVTLNPRKSVKSDTYSQNREAVFILFISQDLPEILGYKIKDKPAILLQIGKVFSGHSQWMFK